MAQRVEHFSVAVDGNGETLQYLTFAGGDGTVEAITVHFPSGCADLVGVQVFYAETQVIPRTFNEYLRGNGQKHRLELQSFPTGSSWAVFLDSTDLYAHTIRFDFEIDELVPVTSGDFGFPPIVLVPLDESLVGVIQRFNDDGVLPLSGFGLPAGFGGTGSSGTGGGTSTAGTPLQAELDALRVAILSASSEQQRSDMQARIDQLVAMGYH